MTKPSSLATGTLLMLAIVPPCGGEDAPVECSATSDALPALFGNIGPRIAVGVDAPAVEWNGVVESGRVEGMETGLLFLASESPVEASGSGAAVETGATASDGGVVERGARVGAVRRGFGDSGVRSVADVPWYRSGPVALFAVLAVIAGAAFGARRLLRGTHLGRVDGLHVISRTYLSPKQSIALVQMGARMVFVGVTPQSITTLRTVGDAVEAAQLRGRSRLASLKGEGFDTQLERQAARYIASPLTESVAEDATSPLGDAKRGVSALLSRARNVGGGSGPQPV